MGFVQRSNGQFYCEYNDGLFGKLIWLFIFAIIVFAALDGDYEAAKFEEKIYCQNVKDGVWPDYKNIYNDVCKEVDK